MKEIITSKKDENQSLKKFLFRYLKAAPSSFVYKMLRKKNITLNGKKADGNETLKEGDVIKLFLSDETIDKFSGEEINGIPSDDKAFRDVKIVYADNDVLIMNKPAGLLTQKASSEDISLNDFVLSYAMEKGVITAEESRHFRPAVVNRLDRNTSGIVIAGLSPDALRVLTGIIRGRKVDKYYVTYVSGDFSRLSGSSYDFSAYIRKDEGDNVSFVINEKEFEKLSDGKKKMYDRIETVFQYEKSGVTILTDKSIEVSRLRVKLLTGKSHQIRASLKYLGYPVIGDYKYGDPEINKSLRKNIGIKHHILHAYEVVFPENVIINGEISEISGRSFKADLPAKLKEIIQ